MINLQNSANQKFKTFASSSNRGKWQSQTKLQGHVIATATAATQIRYITSALIVTEHQRTGTKATENPHTTHTLELSTKGLPRATIGGQPRTEAAGETEDHTCQDLYTACTTAIKPIIASKSVLSTSTPSPK
jgi:hypothetical protein